MAGEAPVIETGHEAEPHGAHDEIHMPPNSWVPIAVAIALMITLVGLLPPLFPIMAIIGGVLLIASLVAWLRAARNEFAELP